MIEFGKDLWRLFGSTPCSSRTTQSRLPRTAYRQFLKISVTCTVWIFLCPLPLFPLPFILSLSTTVKILALFNLHPPFRYKTYWTSLLVEIPVCTGRWWEVKEHMVFSKGYKHRNTVQGNTRIYFPGYLKRLEYNG